MPNRKVRCKTIEGKYIWIDKKKLVFRPSAYAIIKNRGRVLLMTNKTSGKLWPPGGGIEIGESIESGLAREVFEETGLKIKAAKLLFYKENFFYYSPLDEAYHAFLFFFSCQIKSKKIIADCLVNDYESERPRWIDIKLLKLSDIQDFSSEILIMINKD